jgi:hypothetical protein
VEHLRGPIFNPSHVEEFVLLCWRTVVGLFPCTMSACWAATSKLYWLVLQYREVMVDSTGSLYLRCRCW